MAEFDKMGTVTTQMNSIKKTKGTIYPVRVTGQKTGDVLWCTELERSVLLFDY